MQTRDQTQTKEINKEIIKKEYYAIKVPIPIPTENGTLHYSMKKIRAAIPAAPAASTPRTFSPFAPPPCITEGEVVVAAAALLVGEVTSAVSTTIVTSVVVEGWPLSPVTVFVIFVVNEVVDFEGMVDEVVDEVVVVLVD
jgi:hypothetical protein